MSIKKWCKDCGLLSLLKLPQKLTEQNSIGHIGPNYLSIFKKKKEVLLDT
jgi:hypothetical protein